MSRQQGYIDACGLRFIAGFGDVIRSKEQLNEMKIAEDYAKRYNAVILTQCQVSSVGASENKEK